MKLLPYGKILVIDDDYNLTFIMKKFLDHKNFKVDIKDNGFKGLRAAVKNSYDLIIIDIDLPLENGISIVQRIRNKGIETPVIMMTDQYSLEFEIESFKSGTNLFHRKPIEFRLLEVQVKALINNKYKEIFRIGDLTIDLDCKKIYKDGMLLNLTKLEFNVLLLFLKSNGKLYTRDEIMQRVFFNKKDITNGAVDTTISRLRKKLGEFDGMQVIETVFKSGYRVNNFYVNDR